MLITDHPTAYAVVSVVSIMLTTSIIQWTFLIKLKNKHQKQWLHAGSPTIWSDQDFISALPTVKYLKNKDYLMSGCVNGINLCNRFRAPMWHGYWITVLAFCVGITVGVLNGWAPTWK